MDHTCQFIMIEIVTMEFT